MVAADVARLAPMEVRVRLFAALRDLAGASEVSVEAVTVGEMVDRLAERFGPRFEAIARRGSVVVDGDRADARRDLAGATEIALLPPFSGGAVGRG